MICPHCGDDTEAPPTAINIPLDVTSCAPTPMFHVVLNNGAAGNYLNPWSTVCSGAGAAGVAHPINLHYIIGDNNGNR